MIKSKKFLIGEAIAALIIASIIAVIFMVEVDLGIFKIVSPQSLISQYESIKDMNSKLATSKTNYETSIKAVDTAKSEYTKQKEKYEAITDEAISIIKDATADEQYNIDYIWVQIGNYAKANNLVLSLIEPGGTSQTATDTSATSTTTTTTNTQVTSESKPADNQTASTTTSQTKSPSNELSIKVVGNYNDVSSFIFELENDTELRFKLDKIKMEYAGNNQITATFAVKNIKFKK